MGDLQTLNGAAGAELLAVATVFDVHLDALDGAAGSELLAVAAVLYVHARGLHFVCVLV